MPPPPPPGSGPPYGAQPPAGPPYGALPPTGPPGQPPMAGGPYGAPQPQNNTPKTLGIIAIIVGAIGILLGCCCWPVSVLLSIGSLTMAGIGFSQIKDDPNHPDRTLLIVALVIGGLSAVVTLIGFALGVLNVFTGWSEF